MTTQWGAPLTGAQMKLLRAAGLDDGTYKAITRTSEIAGSLKYADFSIAADFFLPHDSPAYTLLEAGWLDGRNVALWFGGDEAPDDWDGGVILTRGGYEDTEKINSPWWCYPDDKEYPDIIAYTRKAEEVDMRTARREAQRQDQANMLARDAETVTIAKMTVNEVAIKVDDILPNKYWTPEIANAHFKGAIDVLQSIGLIKPEPTREDIFWASQPNGGAHVADDVKAWVREALNFERD